MVVSLRKSSIVRFVVWSRHQHVSIYYDKQSETYISTLMTKYIRSYEQPHVHHGGTALPPWPLNPLSMSLETAT